MRVKRVSRGGKHAEPQPRREGFTGLCFHLATCLKFSKHSSGNTDACKFTSLTPVDGSSAGPPLTLRVSPRSASAHTHPTCSTRLIHWKLSSSEASGRCSATSTIRSSCSTVTENTAILGEEGTEMTARQGGPGRGRPVLPRRKPQQGWRETLSNRI